MKVELTLAQLHKLSRLEPGPWRALLAFVQGGGSGDFSPDLQPLREVSLVQKVGPLAYVKFPIDGFLPQQLPQAVRRSSANEMGAFMSIWRKHSKEYLTGADMAALKRFSLNYSVEEFKDLVRSYADMDYQITSPRNLWTLRNRLNKKSQSIGDTVFGDEDE